jgi:hypothetical protein
MSMDGKVTHIEYFFRILETFTTPLWMSILRESLKSNLLRIIIYFFLPIIKFRIFSRSRHQGEILFYDNQRDVSDSTIGYGI